MATKTICDKCGKEIALNTDHLIVHQGENEKWQLCPACMTALREYLTLKPEPKPMPKGVIGAVVAIGGGVAKVVESAPAKALQKGLVSAAENYASHMEQQPSPIKKKEEKKD